MSFAKTALKGVIYHDREKACNGYRLFAGRDSDVYLINMDGEIVHTWKAPLTPGEHMELLPNGNLFFAGHYRMSEDIGLAKMMAGLGGMFMELDWDSNLVWQLEVPYQHHDFAIDPKTNNIIYMTYHPDGVLPDDLAKKIRGGMPGSEYSGQIWGDIIFEVTRSGEVMWQWNAKDHIDPEQDFLSPIENRMICPYVNSVQILEDGNLLLSARHINTIFRVDRKTGKIMNRYGRNLLAHQHDAREVENGNIIVFDNGIQRETYAAYYSRVIEIDPVTDTIAWEYSTPEPTDFYSPICSGAARMKNGNTLIWESIKSRIFEVTMEKEIVWEYVCPIYLFNLGKESNKLWRVHHYDENYAGLAGRKLDPSSCAMENRLFGPPSFVTTFKPVLL